MKTDSQAHEENGPRDIQPNHLDHEIRSAVHSVEPPEWLKDSILSETRKIKEEHKVVRPRFIFRPLAIAAMFLFACILAFFGFGILQNDQLDPEIALREAAAEYVADGGFLLDFNNGSLEKIENWLSEKGAPTFESIPATLKAKDPVGCKKLEWRGQTISLVCFHLPDGGIIHMFIGDRSSEVNALPAELSKVSRFSGLETGGWIEGEKIYILAGSEPSVAIAPFLQG